MKGRKLKVRAGSYDYQIVKAGQPEAYATYPIVPFILLRGYWLEKAGFRIGKGVDVEVRQDQLILTVALARHHHALIKPRLCSALEL